MPNRQIGARVSQLRKERNLTRAEFGKLIGKSEQYVGYIERGTCIMPSDIVIKICDTTGVSADYILRGTIDPLSAAVSLEGFSSDQIQVSLEVVALITQSLRKANGNNSLLHEAFRRSLPRATDTPQ